MQVLVIGAGLAGCEAAWQAARRGLDVTLVEMKPLERSPAHHSDSFAELVCSNSLRSNRTTHAVGLLKEEMRRLGSLVLAAADEAAVPAGQALAVDRELFSARITETLRAHPRVRIEHARIDTIPEDRPVILATGPLTAGGLADELQRVVGEESLYFYDALSPIVYADSIDMEIAFRASRWEDGEGDYLNLPLSREQYETFHASLLEADTVPLHSFERALYFEGCLPIEEMARRGVDTLAYGPMKPVGLRDPRTGERPHAVVQLRQEDKRGVLYSLVGFQTKLRIGEQRRLLRTLPGAAEAVFARFGSVHRNTYLNAPRHLGPSLELNAKPGVYVAGQMSGVEGYVESAALGGLAGIHVAHAVCGRPLLRPDPTTAHGALLAFLGGADAKRFQPMNVNFGLFPPLPGNRKLKRRDRYPLLAERALGEIDRYADAVAPEGFA
ncbi:MAG: methylenetetrahydrofolate--tRNA-(uracil(54)-C(5))-methyltransferase (FADH(2)-oxidizing) TrmFO [Myxococcota bacterium]